MTPMQALAHHHTTAMVSGARRPDVLAFSALPEAPVMSDRSRRRSVMSAVRALMAARRPGRRVTCVSPTPTRMAA